MTSHHCDFQFVEVVRPSLQHQYHLLMHDLLMKSDSSACNRCDETARVSASMCGTAWSFHENASLEGGISGAFLIQGDAAVTSEGVGMGIPTAGHLTIVRATNTNPKAVPSLQPIGCGTS